MESIIFSLNQMGLTESEAKVYLELLKSGPQNGYEVSKNSGVPRSKVYGILESLVIKNFVLSSKSEDPKHYQAISPGKVLGEKKEEYIKNAEKLENSLSQYENNANLEYLWQINSREKIFDICRRMIQQTEKEIFVQIWQEDMAEIVSELEVLERNQIEPIVILYANDKINLPLKHVFDHGYRKEKLEDLGGRWITIVSDSKQAIFAYMQGEQSEAIWTENAAFVFLAKEYVKHDAYCLSLIKASTEIDDERMNETVRNIRNLLKLGKQIK